MLPFGLFTSQIPYFILGVIYLLYMGMSLVNRSEQEENQSLKSQQNTTNIIEFVASSYDATLPVIELGIRDCARQKVTDGTSLCLTTETVFTFYQLNTQSAKHKLFDRDFQSCNISFAGFSRPPPVTA